MVRPQRPAEYEKTAELEALRRELLAEGKDPVTGDNTAAPVEDRPQFSKFSTHRGQAPGGISREQAQQAIDQFRAGLSGAARLDFRVFDTLEAAFGPAHGIKGKVKGAYLPQGNVIALFRDSLDDTADATATLRHETLAHYGLNLLEPAVKMAVLGRVVRSRSNSFLARLFAAAEKDYPEDRNDEFKLAEEVFARVAEDTPGPLRQWFDRLLVKIAQGLRAIGLLKGRVTKAEMRALVASLAEGIRRGAKQRTFPASNRAQFARVAGSVDAPAELLRQEFEAVRNRYAAVAEGAERGAIEAQRTAVGYGTHAALQGVVRGLGGVAEPTVFGK